MFHMGRDALCLAWSLAREQSDKVGSEDQECRASGPAMGSISDGFHR
jgi:hypothetical protein